MQNYKEINGNDYVKDSRTTINETMRSIQSMNSGTVFPTTNLFEGMKCYRTDLKKTYTLTDVENNTWAEDDTASKLSTARKINITGNATGAASFDGSGDANISVTVNESKHAAAADTLVGSTTVLKNDIDTVNNSDTWIPVISNGKIQHTEKLNMKVGAAVSADKATQVIATAPVGGVLDVIHAIMASDDAMRIRIYGDANNGALEIATGDDGTEPIYARQYKNGSIDKFTTVARTAAILDANGNTSFPGTVTAARFTGPLNGTATNADTVDGVHAGSFFYNKGNWAADNWATIGTYQVNGNPPNGNWYGWGQVISSSTDYGRFQLYASDNYGSDGRLHYRTGWDSSKHDWNTILDSENYNKFAPTKTGGGASGTWPISISGNADTVDGYHASDIINRITAANTGGIVAASLTANGYVKFANGLILQWGFVSNTTAAKNYDITFPVSFASACFGVHNTYFKSSGEAGKSGDNWDTVAKITKYGCQLSADNQNVFWTAIGI